MSKSIDHLLNEIGEDVDLLIKPDAWLEEELRHHADQVAKNIEDFNAINLAITIKKFLQDRNLVPYQRYIRDEEGNIQDVLLDIMKLPEAIKSLRNAKDGIDQFNAAGHLNLWRNDGYDLETSTKIAERS